MDQGMLWFDDNPKTDFLQKIKQAADYYKRKYGQSPNLCLVNPAELPRETNLDDKISIRPYRPILSRHFWIGVSDRTRA